MTEPTISQAEALELGYTLTAAQVAELTTLGPIRIRRAAAGRNGPGLGAECPVLPFAMVRQDRSRPSYRFRRQAVADWLRQVAQPWPLPSDAIKTAEAIAILAGAEQPWISPEYKRLHKRLADATDRLTEYRLLGEKRYSRAEVERLAGENLERGLTTEPLPQALKGRHRLPGGDLLDTREAGAVLGERRMSGALSPGSVAQRAREEKIPGIKRHGRWWFEP